MTRSPAFDPGFWSRWVVANSLAELIGLGVVGLAGYTLLHYVGQPTSAAAALLFAASAVILGAFERAIVGLFQARVLRSRLPQLQWWVAATVIGAVAESALGMLPNTIVHLRASPGQPQVGEIPDLVQRLLAVPM